MKNVLALTEREQAKLDLYRSFVAFRLTLPDRNAASLGMRPVSYAVPVGQNDERDCQLTVREVSARHDLWTIVFPDNDSTKWCDTKGRFVRAELFESYDSCFNPALFNRLPIIMARLPQAIAYSRQLFGLK